MRRSLFSAVAVSFACLVMSIQAQPPLQSSDSSAAPLRQRWSVPTIISVADERRVQDIASERLERGRPTIPQFQSVVGGGYLFLRTPKRMVAVNYATGKRELEYPWVDSEADGILGETRGGGDDRDRLERQLWNDAPYASMTIGDGNLFLLDKVGPILPRRGRRRVILMPRGRARDPSEDGSNELVALEIKTMGKLQWIVGGANRNDEPRLVGGYFLSSGSVHESVLYVVVEFEEKLQLAALDAKTGGLQWSLTLAELGEKYLLENFRLRRIAAVTPVVVGERLICPTALGKVAAVDIELREMAWETSYWPKPTDGEEGPERPKLASQGNRWLDNVVLRAGDVVIVTPMDSQRLYCLDVESGEVQWRMEREDRLFAAVKGDVCLLIGPNDIEARDTRSGMPRWEGRRVEFSEGAMPSGRGVFDGHEYLLPTTRGELLSIDCRNGESSVIANTETPLGNLLLHDGELISTGFDQVRVLSR